MTPDLIAAIACTVILAAVLLVWWWHSRRPAEGFDVLNPSDGNVEHCALCPPERSQKAIEAELARTTDPDLRDVLLDKLIEATRSEA